MDQHYSSARDTFKRHAAQLLRLGNEPAPDNSAEQVLQLETFLANNSRPATDRRDPKSSFNVMNLVGLRHLTRGAIDWQIFFDRLGVPAAALDRIVVKDIDFFASLPEYWLRYSTKKMEILRAYFKFQLLVSMGPHLPQAFRDAVFQISKLTTGAEHPPPRATFCAKLIDDNLGELVGRLYALEKVQASTVEEVKAMIRHISHAFETAINSSSWLDADTRTRSAEKLRAISGKVGFPLLWTDYSPLHVANNTLVANLMAVSSLNFAQEISRLVGNVSRELWFMNSHTINAYYNAQWNEIVITGGILQPPFYAPDWPQALQYGSLGSVIGHEFTHALDDKGRMFDKDGYLREWWSSAGVASYEQQTKCLESWYGSFEMKAGNETLTLDGKLSLGTRSWPIFGARDMQETNLRMQVRISLTAVVSAMPIWLGVLFLQQSPQRRGSVTFLLRESCSIWSLSSSCFLSASHSAIARRCALPLFAP